MKILKRGKVIELHEDHAENVIGMFPNIYSRIDESINPEDKQREELGKYTDEQLFGICGEIGIGVKSHYKRETLINKIIEATKDAEKIDDTVSE